MSDNRTEMEEGLAYKAEHFYTYNQDRIVDALFAAQETILKLYCLLVPNLAAPDGHGIGHPFTDNDSTYVEISEILDEMYGEGDIEINIDE